MRPRQVSLIAAAAIVNLSMICGAQAQGTSCAIDNLKDTWLDKHTAARKAQDGFEALVKALSVTPPSDPDYKPEQFGGEDKKKEFKLRIKDLNEKFNASVERAVLLAKDKCYVCLVKSNWDAANTAKKQCAELNPLISADQDLKDEDPSNCENLKEFTRVDMEAPELDSKYWQDVDSDQRHLKRVLNDSNSTGRDKRQALNYLRKDLKKFVDYHSTHNGDATQLETDIKAVGDTCTVGGRVTVLFRFEQ
jgi:hypothetical protein